MSKSKALVKKKKETLSKVKDLASSIVGEISLSELSTKVANKLDTTPEEALDFIQQYGLDRQIHDLLVDQVTEGAIASKAMEILKNKLDEGDLEAAKIVLGFNKKLRPANTRVINEMSFQDNRVFIELDKEAKKRLGEGDVIDVEAKETD